MATLLLSTAGAALGGSFGGSALGLSSLAIGKAVGATLGNVIDQTVLGQGSAAVETGRVDQFRIMGAHEGSALPRVYGRVRLPGHVIWSSRFLESVNEENVGGKGGGQKVNRFSYSINLALALCEGEVQRVGRIWADGNIVDQSELTFRLHHGTEDQQPDPVISAIEGAEMTPGYRGLAYVVFENLELAPFGNRIPQFNFEVFRRPARADGHSSTFEDIEGVALVPGTGEYALATEPVYFERGKGETVAVNVHNDLGEPDLSTSLGQLSAEMPRADAVSLVVTWFGDDLRCGHCSLRPAVEQVIEDPPAMPWRVSGQTRETAKVVSELDGRPVFGGTPTDQSVVQAIRHMNENDRRVMFYPFILMDILSGNGRADPWSGAAEQPVIPWRGRITLSAAPGRPESPDKTPAARDEVAAFFGNASASDFSIDGDTVRYSGAEDWGYRRFILHYAHLCAAAGGVAAFCIGSELRGLTQIRASGTSYPVVEALVALARDVRDILGPGTKIGYAADWSEYFGHRPDDGSGDVLFHLDPLWAAPEIDFVGIDNYMPLSDWRDGSAHADLTDGARSIYDIDYLKSNVVGGEGFDWYYADPAARDAQARTPISDGAHGEDWVFRYKDLLNWWANPHHNRPGGVRDLAPTDWVPGSKPIWFTELGCPAVDKGTNQPNVFHDPKSSESFLPYYSNGAQDAFIQRRYLDATYSHWRDPANNPRSDIYGGPMVDLSNAYVWAWDARPWPDFPARLNHWVDGVNYELGHWLNGRAMQVALADVVSEICTHSGVWPVDTASLHGAIIGYSIDAVQDARASLQPLMLAYAFDSYSVDGRVAFASRDGLVSAAIDDQRLVFDDKRAVLQRTRAPVAESAGRVLLGYIREDKDYSAGAATALANDDAEPNTAQSSLPLVLGANQARTIAERWLTEGQLARDTVSFALPPSALDRAPGDVIALNSGARPELYRIDRIDDAGARTINATRIEGHLYSAALPPASVPEISSLVVATPVYAEFLDLPLLTGEESPHAPHVAAAKRPWAGAIAVYSSSADHGYTLNTELRQPAKMGVILDDLDAATCGVLSPATVRVRISQGILQSRPMADVLNGANVAAIGQGGGNWEVLQFRTAVLIEQGEYALSGLLRGQAGTDGIMPDVWPAGSDFVLLDSAIRQIDLPASARGLTRHYRIGLASKPLTSPSFIHREVATEGAGLRPYRPTHLRAARQADGAVRIEWIRRTRIDGDSWQGPDVPLGEARELYTVRIRSGGQVVRTLTAESTSCVYAPEDQNADGVSAGFVIEAAQISESFGPGPYERIVFDG